MLSRRLPFVNYEGILVDGNLVLRSKEGDTDYELVSPDVIATYNTVGEPLAN